MNKLCPICGKPYVDIGMSADGGLRYVHTGKPKQGYTPLKICTRGKQ